eukprot:1165597-Ditylum_brightwellii.AAC.1
MDVEVKYAKITWLQIWAKPKCSAGSSNEEDIGNDDEVKEIKEDDVSNELLPHMAQTIPSMSGKKKMWLSWLKKRKT